MPLSVLRGQRAPGGSWTEHDRSLAVALTLHEDSLCSGCGHPLEETTSADADPANRSGAWHYEVDPPHRCQACTALAAAQKEYEDADAGHALRWRAERINHDESQDLTD